MVLPQYRGYTDNFLPWARDVLEIPDVPAHFNHHRRMSEITDDVRRPPIRQRKQQQDDANDHEEDQGQFMDEVRKAAEESTQCHGYTDNFLPWARDVLEIPDVPAHFNHHRRMSEITDDVRRPPIRRRLRQLKRRQGHNQVDDQEQSTDQELETEPPSSKKGKSRADYDPTKEPEVFQKFVKFRLVKSASDIAANAEHLKKCNVLKDDGTIAAGLKPFFCVYCWTVDDTDSLYMDGKQLSIRHNCGFIKDLENFHIVTDATDPYKKHVHKKKLDLAVGFEAIPVANEYGQDILHEMLENNTVNLLGTIHRRFYLHGSSHKVYLKEILDLLREHYPSHPTTLYLTSTSEQTVGRRIQDAFVQPTDTGTSHFVAGDRFTEPVTINIPPHPTALPSFPPDVEYDDNRMRAVVKLELTRIRQIVKYYEKMGDTESAKKYSVGKLIDPLSRAIAKADPQFWRELFA